VSYFGGELLQLADNPAFLDSSLSNAVSFSYLNYLAGINQASIAYGRTVDSVGFVSGYLRYFDYGKFLETDEVGNELGSFRGADYEIGVSLTRVYSKNITYGVSFKQLFSSLYQYFGYGVGLDAGVFYTNPKYLFNAGLVVKNLGFEVIDLSGTARNWLPARADISITKKFAKAPIQLGLQYNHLQRWNLANVDTELEDETKWTFDNLARHISASVGFVPNEKFQLFIGYNVQRRLELATTERPRLIGFSFGSNINLKRFSLYYSLASYHLSGASHSIGLKTNIHNWTSKSGA